MSTNFPGTSIDTYTTHVNGDTIDSSHVNNLQDAVNAIETKVGIDNSAVTSSLDYKIKNVPLSSLSDFNVSLPATNDILKYNGTKWANSSVTNIKFGGDGSDGALSITSGTTTIDCAGAAVVTKNYTSISITGSGKLAFSNPNTNGTVVVLKSQGNVTLTSSATPMIDCTNTGGAVGSDAKWGSWFKNSSGGNGASAAYTSTASGGAGGSPSQDFTAYSLTRHLLRYPWIFIGSAGGNGAVSPGTGSPTAGTGGRGGGCLIIECGGAWNFTTSGGISVAGSAGGAASGGVGGASGAIASGGSGGGGGCFIGLYNTLTANTGTVSSGGGAGGAGSGTGTGGNTGEASAGGGGSGISAGFSGTDVHNTNNTGPTGSAGGAGASLLAQNTYFS